MTGAAPRKLPSAPLRKTPMSVSDSMRRNRILSPQQCIDTHAKLANLDRLIAAAEREYRMTTAELDRLNNEGRAWLVVDLVHKTALASLDLGAAFLQATGNRVGDAARLLADGTQTASDAITGVAAVQDGTMSRAELTRTLAQRGLAHLPAGGAGAASARGAADIALSGWSGLDGIVQAQGTPSAGARMAEAGVDMAAAMIQRSADTLDAGTQGGSATARRVGAVAQIARAMASYNRELEGAFNRRLQISGELNATKANFQATMNRTMTRYRQDAAQMRQLLASCQ